MSPFNSNTFFFLCHEYGLILFITLFPNLPAVEFLLPLTVNNIFFNGTVKLFVHSLFMYRYSILVLR